MDKRTLAQPVEYRFQMKPDGTKTHYAEGYAARFGELSHPLGGGRQTFVERIQAGAFDRVMDERQDVVALYNHDPSKVLGRVSNGELKLDVDKEGLRYKVRLPDTTFGRDLAVSLERRDIAGSSFGFRASKDTWGRHTDGMALRTVTEIDRLADISPVTSPAYGASEAGLAIRSLDSFLESEHSHQTANLKRWLFIEGLKA